MSRPYALMWLGILVQIVALEVWGVWGRKAPGDTLSEATAHLFRTSTTVGFSILTSLIVFVLLWFPLHTRRFDKRAKSDTDATP